MEKSRYDYLGMIDEIFDEAISNLSPDSFNGLLDAVKEMIRNIEED